MGGWVVKAMSKLFRWTAESYPACNATITKAGRGLPLAKRVVIHTREDGRISIRPLEYVKEEGITRGEFIAALREVARSTEEDDQSDSETD